MDAVNGISVFDHLVVGLIYMVVMLLRMRKTPLSAQFHANREIYNSEGNHPA